MHTTGKNDSGDYLNRQTLFARFSLFIYYICKTKSNTGGRKIDNQITCLYQSLLANRKFQIYKQSGKHAILSLLCLTFVY